MNEKQGVLARLAGQAIARPELKKPYRVRVACKRFVEKAQPHGRLAMFRCNAGQFGDIFVRLGIEQFAGSQVNGAARRSQLQLVTIPDIAVHRMRAVGTCETFGPGGDTRLADLLFAVA